MRHECSIIIQGTIKVYLLILQVFLFLQKEHRSVGLARPIELGKAEHAVKSATEEAKLELVQTRQQIEGVAASEASLDAKIDKKRVELERTHKRLQSLKKVRYEKYYTNL